MCDKLLADFMQKCDNGFKNPQIIYNSDKNYNDARSEPETSSILIIKGNILTCLYEEGNRQLLFNRYFTHYKSWKSGENITFDRKPIQTASAKIATQNDDKWRQVSC
jgi:hypothetical protein